MLYAIYTEISITLKLVYFNR